MINILSHNIFIALGGKLEHLSEFRGALSFLRLLIASSLQWMQTGFSMNLYHKTQSVIQCQMVTTSFLVCYSFLNLMANLQASSPIS